MSVARPNPLDNAEVEQPAGTRVGAAAYVAAMTADLAAMARRHNLETLGYLLDMARLEAENTAQGTGKS